MSERIDEKSQQDQQPVSTGPAHTKSQYYMDPDNLDHEMSKIPLFMSNLPDEDNDTLAAIQALAYDGTPEEVAQNFREQGNDCFRAGKKKYNDAISFYTQAINTECSDKSIIEACLANRAACNLELQNFRRVLEDCSKCLGINPKNVKALYRSAKALFALEKLVECIDCCDHALVFDPESKAISEVRDQAVKKKSAMDEKIRLKAEREERERNKKATLEKAFKERNIKIEVVDKEVHEKANIEYDHETNTINWPVFFLYPEYKESDYIQSFNDSNTFQDQLEVIFEQPAPWDTTRKYNVNAVEVYFEDTRGLNPKLIRVGKKLPLGKVLSLEQYIVKNGVPSFVVLPKGDPFQQKFIDNFRK